MECMRVNRSENCVPTAVVAAVKLADQSSPASGPLMQNALVRPPEKEKLGEVDGGFVESDGDVGSRRSERIPLKSMRSCGPNPPKGLELKEMGEEEGAMGSWVFLTKPRWILESTKACIDARETWCTEDLIPGMDLFKRSVKKRVSAVKKLLKIVQPMPRIENEV